MSHTRLDETYDPVVKIYDILGSILQNLLNHYGEEKVESIFSPIILRTDDWPYDQFIDLINKEKFYRHASFFKSKESKNLLLLLRDKNINIKTKLDEIRDYMLCPENKHKKLYKAIQSAEIKMITFFSTFPELMRKQAEPSVSALKPG